uniref:Leucyl/phenylalanyl-tRNA protein transferase n=1 Tax=Toxoplasma gondii TgCATBr9 TaxID=943120 RepID=A0A2T6IVU8_TOXGO|nr:leucyl/phenylalanyl-tRNA protein transferase [Toxoplasma gondii TgCATBr9]
MLAASFKEVPDMDEIDNGTSYKLSPSEIRDLLHRWRGLRHLPHLGEEHDLEDVASRLTAVQFPCDFLWSSVISAPFYARLLHAAFLPIGHRVTLKRKRKQEAKGARMKVEASQVQETKETAEANNAAPLADERGEEQRAAESETAGAQPERDTARDPVVDRRLEERPCGAGNRDDEDREEEMEQYGAQTDEKEEETEGEKEEKEKEEEGAEEEGESSEEDDDSSLDDSESDEEADAEDDRATEGDKQRQRPGSPTSRDPMYILLPKLHQERCCLLLDQMTPHISRNTRKRAKRFCFSIDRDFDGVLAGCVRQHGEGWLYPPVRQALRELQRIQLRRRLREEKSRHETGRMQLGEMEDEGRRVDLRSEEVSVHSIEVWTRNDAADATCGLSGQRKTSSKHPERHYTHGKSLSGSSEPTSSSSSFSSSRCSSDLRSHVAASSPPSRWSLCAGEIGVRIGGVYTSLTGFSFVNEAGNVQLAALGILLKLTGIRLWDVGMELAYKKSLGSQTLPRPEFLRLFRVARGIPANPPLTTETARRLLQAAGAKEVHALREGNGSPRVGPRLQEVGPQAGETRRDSSQPHGISGDAETSLDCYTSPSHCSVTPSCSYPCYSYRSSSSPPFCVPASPASYHSNSFLGGGEVSGGTGWPAGCERGEEKNEVEEATLLNCDCFVEIYRREQERESRRQKEANISRESGERKRKSAEKHKLKATV